MTNIDKIFEAQEYIEPDEGLKGDTGYYGMVASAVKEATEAGNEILKQGGNAFDAIIAVQLALAVVEGMNTGVGAGGFILCMTLRTKIQKSSMRIRKRLQHSDRTASSMRTVMKFRLMSVQPTGRQSAYRA